MASNGPENMVAARSSRSALAAVPASIAINNFSAINDAVTSLFPQAPPVNLEATNSDSPLCLAVATDVVRGRPESIQATEQRLGFGSADPDLHAAGTALACSR